MLFLFNLQLGRSINVVKSSTWTGNLFFKVFLFLQYISHYDFGKDSARGTWIGKEEFLEKHSLKIGRIFMENSLRNDCRDCVVECVL